VADEPTGNLDSRAADNVLDLFESLARGGKTVLIVTHDPSITQRTDQTIILSDGEIIDPAVARALPFLSHPQMLEATRRAGKRTVAPGSPVLRQGEPVEYFFMVVSGQVEIVVHSDRAGEMQLSCLGPGQFFGEVELTQGGHAIASVRGGSDGAELALLPKSHFYELIDGSPLTRHALHDVATARLAENRRRKGDR
jgi:CRP-like cAMP-binding protein